MAAYAIGRLQMRNPAWLQEYGSKTPALVAKHGGKYLVRGSGIERLEGSGMLPSVERMQAEASRVAMTLESRSQVTNTIRCAISIRSRESCAPISSSSCRRLLSGRVLPT